MSMNETIKGTIADQLRDDVMRLKAGASIGVIYDDWRSHINGLRLEAGEHGDQEQVALCDAASTSRKALIACLRVLSAHPSAQGEV
jgi:hypothetical protein